MQRYHRSEAVLETRGEKMYLRVRATKNDGMLHKTEAYQYKSRIYRQGISPRTKARRHEGRWDAKCSVRELWLLLLWVMLSAERGW